MNQLLLVEDDAIIANIYQRKLKMENFAVTHAADGEVAIDNLKTAAPEIVLLDLQLPKKNGVDVIQFIRSNPATKEVPVVVFTNSYLGTLVQAAWDAGATKCLTKAICTPTQVAEVLRATLDGRDIGIGGRGQPPGGASESAAPTAAPPPVPAPAPAAPTISPSEAIPATGALAELLRSTTSAPAAPPPTSPAAPLANVAPAPAPPAPSEPTVPSAAPSKRTPRVPRRPRVPTSHTQMITQAQVEPPSEDQFQLELRKGFADSLPPALAYIRQKLQAFIKNENDQSSLRWAEDRSATLFDMYRKMHSVTAGAGTSGCFRIARVSAAFEALLTELAENTDKINDSTVRTLVSTVDFLGLLFDKVAEPEGNEFTNANIMVVDDEPLSRIAVMRGLEKAELSAKDVADPTVAAELAADQSFSLIFLDIDMPGMDGYELCKKIRATPMNAKTPVIFVTGLTDFMVKAKSSLSGGSDLIGKPFLATELAVKTLSYLVKSRFDQ
jgi:CheY-like chemotaxis protein